MNNSNPIEGPFNPADKTVKKKGAEPDPDKFKELLKTEESDETKKQKKQTEELEEELEDEELSEEELAEKSSVFQSFMQDRSQSSDSIFESQESEPQRRPEAPTESNQESYNQMYFPQQSNEEPVQEIEDLGISGSKPTQTSPRHIKDKATKKKPSAYEKAKGLQKQGVDNQELSVAGAKKLKKTPTPKSGTVQEKKPIAGPTSIGTIDNKELQTKVLQPDDDKNPISSETLLKKKSHESIKVEPKILGEKQKIKEQKIKEQKTQEQETQQQLEQAQVAQEGLAADTAKPGATAFQSTQTVQGGDAISKASLAASAARGKVPIYSSFPKTLFSLFQKLAGLITIQTLKGMQKTEITLSMKNSIFNGLVVRLDHYNTNPHMFNLQFFCSPQAQEALIANIPNLVQAFEQGKFSFKVNILNPSLLQEKKIKKVEKSTKESIQ